MKTAKEVFLQLVNRAITYRMWGRGPNTEYSSDYSKELATRDVGELVKQTTAEEREALQTLTTADIQKAEPYKSLYPEIWYSKEKKTRCRHPIFKIPK